MLQHASRWGYSAETQAVPLRRVLRGTLLRVPPVSAAATTQFCRSQIAQLCVGRTLTLNQTERGANIRDIAAVVFPLCHVGVV